MIKRMHRCLMGFVLLSTLLLSMIQGYAQEAQAIEKLFKKGKVQDLEIIYSSEEVPHNLNLSCEIRLKTGGKKEVSVSGNLIPVFFISEDVEITPQGRLLLKGNYILVGLG